MNTRALQCFIKVYEKKSITSAAKEVYISPQGLSKIIKQLEVELETELFFRGSQGMEATESGEILFARARHICYLIDDIKKEITILNGSRDAINVIISTSATFCIQLDHIFNFTDEYPKYHIKVQDYADNAPIAPILQEEADIGIVLGHEGISDCYYDVLRKGKTVLVLSEDHPLASVDEISLKDLENEVLVVKRIESDKDHPLINRCIQMGINPVIKHESENLSVIHQLCKNQNVVGVSVDYLEKALPVQGLVTKKLKEDIPQYLYFISRRRDVENPAVKLLLEYLKRGIK